MQQHIFYEMKIAFLNGNLYQNMLKIKAVPHSKELVPVTSYRLLNGNTFQFLETCSKNFNSSKGSL